MESQLDRDIAHVRDRNPVEDDPIEYEQAARRLADWIDATRFAHVRTREVERPFNGTFPKGWE